MIDSGHLATQLGELLAGRTGAAASSARRPLPLAGWPVPAAAAGAKPQSFAEAFGQAGLSERLPFGPQTRPGEGPNGEHKLLISEDILAVPGAFRRAAQAPELIGDPALSGTLPVQLAAAMPVPVSSHPLHAEQVPGVPAEGFSTGLPHTAGAVPLRPAPAAGMAPSEPDRQLPPGQLLPPTGKALPPASVETAVKASATAPVRTVTDNLQTASPVSFSRDGYSGPELARHPAAANRVAGDPTLAATTTPAAGGSIELSSGSGVTSTAAPTSLRAPVALQQALPVMPASNPPTPELAEPVRTAAGAMTSTFATTAAEHATGSVRATASTFPTAANHSVLTASPPRPTTPDYATGSATATTPASPATRGKTAGLPEPTGLPVRSAAGPAELRAELAADPAAQAATAAARDSALPGAQSVQKILATDAQPAGSYRAADAMTDPQATSRQLAQQIGVLARDGVQSARIQLYPEHLGQVDVRILIDDDGARINLHAHTAHGREAIDASLHRLRELCADQGLPLTDANVTSGDERAAQHNLRERAQQAAMAQPRQPVPAGPELPGDRPAAPGRDTAHRLVDLFA